MIILRVVGLLLLAYVLLGGLIYVFQRSLIYHPTHFDVQSVMEPWEIAGTYVGYRRDVAEPTGVWLVTHGNGGQAAHRDYLLQQVEPSTQVYVLEYPGYGDRPGKTTADAINQAAREAWAAIKERHPDLPAGVIGESLGSGPASLLAQAPHPPDKIVLLVPFDEFYKVAATQYGWLPVKQLMVDQWNNVAALSGFKGGVEIYAAASDEIVPKVRAEALAAAIPQARYVEMPGTHNAWIWEERFSLGDSPPTLPTPREDP